MLLGNVLNAVKMFLAKWNKKPTPASCSSPAPSQNTILVGCPVPCSTIRETCHSDSPVPGLLGGNLYFSWFCSKGCQNLLCPMSAFPSASLLHSTHFCCQNSVQVLFILDVHKSYLAMQWPLLSDVLLSLVPSDLSCLFPLWHVPIKLQALWGKGLPFFMNLEIATVFPQPE